MNLWDTVDLSSSTFENLSKICSVHHKAGDICISTFTCPPTLAWRAPAREMENISGGPTFGDFVTIRTEASMQDITVARLQSTRVQTPLSPLSESLCGQSKYFLRITKDKGVVGNLCISLAPAKVALNLNFVSAVGDVDELVLQLLYAESAKDSSLMKYGSL